MNLNTTTANNNNNYSKLFSPFHKVFFACSSFQLRRLDFLTYFLGQFFWVFFFLSFWYNHRLNERARREKVRANQRNEHWNSMKKKLFFHFKTTTSKNMETHQFQQQQLWILHCPRVSFCQESHARSWRMQKLFFLKTSVCLSVFNLLEYIDWGPFVFWKFVNLGTFAWLFLAWLEHEKSFKSCLSSKIMNPSTFFCVFEWQERRARGAEKYSKLSWLYSGVAVEIIGIWKWYTLIFLFFVLSAASLPRLVEPNIQGTETGTMSRARRPLGSSGRSCVCSRYGSKIMFKEHFSKTRTTSPLFGFWGQRKKKKKKSGSFCVWLAIIVVCSCWLSLLLGPYHCPGLLESTNFVVCLFAVVKWMHVLPRSVGRSVGRSVSGV